MSYEAPPGGETLNERQARLLAAFSVRAARIGHIIADRIEAADAADDDDKVARLSMAYAAIGRSLRQTLALERRAAREAEQAEREDARAQAAHTPAVDARKHAYRAVLRDQAFSEVERADFDLPPEDRKAARELMWAQFCHEIEAALDAESADPQAFLAEPLEPQLARLVSRTVWARLDDDDDEDEDGDDDFDAAAAGEGDPPPASPHGGAPPEFRADSS